MARNRMLNPEFWLDEELSNVSPHARLLYMGLWGICDDNYATFPDMPGWIKAQIFPYETVDVKKLLLELAKVNKIILFEKEERRFWYIKNFLKYQKVEHPSKPKYPKFDGVITEPSPNPHQPLAPNIIEVNLNKDNLIKESVADATTPKDTAIEFFKQVELLKNGEKDKAQRLLEQINALMEKNNVPYEPLFREIVKFSSYWTELNKTGKKQRWEMEKTFEVSRRLGTWFSKIRQFQGQNQNNNGPKLIKIK